MTSPAGTNITSILKETRQFPPSAEFAGQAHVPSLASYEQLLLGQISFSSYCAAPLQ